METMKTTYFVSTHDEAAGRVTPTCIDIVRPDGLSMINGHSLEKISQDYPNVKIMTPSEFEALQESTEFTDPVEITEEKFTEMLCVLPPMRWNNRGPSETFIICEFKTGRITGIYCRIGEKYYSFFGVCTMNHDEIVNKCLDSRGKTGVSNETPSDIDWRVCKKCGWTGTETIPEGHNRVAEDSEERSSFTVQLCPECRSETRYDRDRVKRT